MKKTLSCNTACPFKQCLSNDATSVKQYHYLDCFGIFDGHGQSIFMLTCVPLLHIVTQMCIGNMVEKSMAFKTMGTTRGEQCQTFCTAIILMSAKT